MSGRTDKLARVLDPLCVGLGVDLDDVDLHAGVLRVTVEAAAEPGSRPQAPRPPLDLDRLAEVSRVVSTLLDEREDLAPSGRYELEVSTPGVERRLRRPEQFRRVVGATVAVRTVAGTPGERRLEGVLTAVEDDSFQLRSGAEDQVRTLRYPEVERAHTVFDWRRALAGGEVGDPAAARRGAPRTGKGGPTKSGGSNEAGERRGGSRPEKSGRSGSTGGATTQPDAVRERATTS